MDNYQSAKRLMENINQVFVGKETVVSGESSLRRKSIKGTDGAPADAETEQKMGVHLLPNLRLNPHSLLQSPITSYIIKITIHGLITAL